MAEWADGTGADAESMLRIEFRTLPQTEIKPGPGLN